MESVNRDLPEAFHSDQSELKWFVAAMRAGLEGHPHQMQQFLRRSLRRLPSGIQHDPALVEAIRDVATTASAPVTGSARDRARDLTSPQRLHEYYDGFDPAPSAILDRDLDHLPEALNVDRVPAERPILDSAVQESLDSILASHVADLGRWGVNPVSKVLLTGPPGTGKTMAARWVAHDLDLPLLVLNLADVMSHELGRSAKNLASAMRYCAANKVVLLVDEFDAVASARADSTDVGEARRLVNVLLMALDDWPSHSVLIAATNHPELLDRAVERRFDELVHLHLPGLETRAQIWARQIADLTPDEQLILAELADAASGAAIVRTAQRSKRAAALQGREVTFEDALNVVLSHQPAQPPRSKRERDRLIRLLATRTGLSRRSIADVLQVSHTTVNAVVREA